MIKSILFSLSDVINDIVEHEVSKNVKFNESELKEKIIYHIECHFERKVWSEVDRAMDDLFEENKNEIIQIHDLLYSIHEKYVNE